MLNWQIEQDCLHQGFSSICGVDEAGRGPLAGPVTAAAVILPHGIEIAGVNDSKKLTEKKREGLFDEICEKAIAYSIVSVDHQVVDQINILQATFLAMKNAVESLSVAADFALIDGNRSQGLQVPHTCVVGGDAKSPSIAAASILAKVTRDRMMVALDATYSGYGFAKHKGYGTKAHYAAILEQGVCDIHRVTFLKKFLADHPEVKR